MELSSEATTVVLVAAVAIALYNYFEEQGTTKEVIDVNWTLIGIYFGLALLGLFLLFVVFKIIKNRTRSKKDEKKNRENLIEKLKEILHSDLEYATVSEMEKEIYEGKKFIFKLPEDIKEEYKKDIELFNDSSEGIIEYWQEEEREEERRKLREKKEKEAKEREFERQVQELFDFKKVKNSEKAMPVDKKYDNHVIYKANEKFDVYLLEKKNSKRLRKEAIEYYQKNDLDTKPEFLSKDEERIYSEVREDIKGGRLNIKKKVVLDLIGEPLKENFYRARDLSKEEKLMARNQGFEHVKGIELDGKICPGGFYIKKSMEKESNYHFCTKYLFKELHPVMKVESCIKGKFVDVAYKNKIGIEIETGTNKLDQLAAKIPWLNANFETWIFVCSRKFVGKYSRFVDNKQSFCFTPKKARDKVKEVLQL
tara:strand:- start:223 stop:1494 length:1272 start_codon:yes stop_codon:yes gene_type:complete